MKPIAFTTLPEWFFYQPLPPLAVLIPTGLDMFVLPYFRSQQNGLPAARGGA